MDALVEWGLPIVVWIQTFRTPFLDVFFEAVSLLGDEDFYILLLPLIYWCLHKEAGRRLAVLFLSTSYLNFYFKSLFAGPRPFEVDPNVYAPRRSPGPGIPSGHAQWVTATWGFFATQLRKPFWWVLAGILVVLTSISRMYLGDHFPQDVIAGVLIGGLYLAGFLALEPPVERWLKERANFWTRLVIAAITPLLFAALFLNEYSAVVLGSLWGMAIGMVLEGEWVQFDHRGPFLKQVLKVAIGLAVVIGLRTGLKAVLPEGDLASFIRYGVIGFWLILGAPWVFVQTRLSGQLSRPPANGSP